MTQKKLFGLTILGILLTVCIFSAWFFLNGQRPSSEIATMPAEKVIIKAYLNLGSGCQQETIDLLDNLAKEYSGKVFVEYIDFSTNEGAERARKDGLSCAGLVINGKQIYAIIDKNGAQKDVTFSHPINAQYTADDVKTVVKMLLGE